MNRIHLDYASLTPVDSRVFREMKKYSSPEYANPSSLYQEGVLAKKTLDEGRAKIAGLIHAHPDEIVFTSGGTEANNLALDGVVRAARMSGITKPHVVISNIEHSSIMETANMLEKYGVEVTRIPVNNSGLVILDGLKKAIKENTVLVSIMTVNNEIGTIQPIREIAKIVRDARKSSDASVYPLFHTDAAQAALFQELYVEKLGVDLLTLDGSKVYGPRGVGCLFVKRNTSILPIIQGGGQERGLRSGTENVPGIMGLAKALEIANEEREKEATRLIELKGFFLEELMKIVPEATVNPPLPKNNREVGVFVSPHIINISIPGIDNEFFVLQLDAKGIACSTKSSCLRDSDESYVLKAVGADSKTSIRFSFGRWTKKKDLKKTLDAVRSILGK